VQISRSAIAHKHKRIVPGDIGAGSAAFRVKGAGAAAYPRVRAGVWGDQYDARDEEVGALVSLPVRVSVDDLEPPAGGTWRDDAMSDDAEADCNGRISSPLTAGHRA
jgi:hypothetical protein